VGKEDNPGTMDALARGRMQGPGGVFGVGFVLNLSRKGTHDMKAPGVRDNPRWYHLDRDMPTCGPR